MGKIFTRKQFSNYLGETRAILDVDTSFFQDITPIPITPTPTKTSTPTPTPTPTSTISVTPTPTPTPTQISNLFYVGAGFDANVGCILLDEPNNSLYVGGTFGFYQGNNNLFLAKISTDGSWDSGFQSAIPYSNTGRSVRTIIQTETPDEIYVGGEFPTYTGLSTGNFTRINKNTGVQVSGWDGTNANNVVSNGVLDGNQVVLVGAFSSYKGTTRNRIVRLNSNNSVDASIFGGTAFNAAPFGILKNNAGNYVVYGGATTYFGANIGRIVEIDPTTGNNTGLFGTGFGATVMNEVAYDPSTGYYYCVGNLTMSYQGGSQSFIYVLDSTGAVVSSTAPFVSTLNCFGIYGDFANDALYLAFSAPTGFRKVIISTWSEDTTWATNRGVINGTSTYNAGKFAITDASAKTYIGGTFTRYNNQNYNRIIRLNSNGTTNSYI